MAVRFLAAFAMAISALSFASVCSAAESPEKQITACMAAIGHAFEESRFLKTHPEFALTKKGGEIILSYHTRQWLVYGFANMSDDWLGDLEKKTGPDNDGIIITVSFRPPARELLQGFEKRYREIDLAGMGENGDRRPAPSNPYWLVYECGANLEEDGVELNIVISVATNFRTSKKLLDEAFAPIARAFKGKTTLFNPYVKSFHP